MAYPEPLNKFLNAWLFWELELRDPEADTNDMTVATNRLARTEEEFIRWLRESEGMECSWFKNFGHKDKLGPPRKTPLRPGQVTRGKDGKP